MPACQVVPTADAFASGMIAFLDCQAQTLGAAGYNALAAPGSIVTLAIGAFITILVALIGYRLLFADAPSLREGVLAVVKIGAVLALATSWPAYQTLVYDTVLEGPADLAAAIGGAAGLPGSAGGLPVRLDGVDRSLRTLSVYGVGLVQFQQDAVDPARAPPLFIGFDTFALGAAHVLFLGGAIGAFAFLRLAAGLLLAMGPFFIAFLLFDATRGLFEGWLRALVGIALGSVAAAVMLGVELALLEPWVASLIATRVAGGPIIGVPATLLTTTAVFAALLAATLLLVGRIAAGLHLPVWSAAIRFHRNDTVLENTLSKAPAMASIATSAPPIAARTRAAAVADSVLAAQVREERLRLEATGIPAMPPAAGSVGSGRPSYPAAFAGGVRPVGQGVRRRTTGRVSASASARDRMA